MSNHHDFLTGGGQAGELMRSLDWARSPLGSPDGWPHSLRTVVDLLLQSQFPMFVAWGEDLGFLYNDSYAEILGGKHPGAMGRRFHEIWSEIWPDISPLIEAAMKGEATYREDLPLVMNRKGYDEQTWFTFSYSPVRDESGRVAGMFCACTETTEKIMTVRALRASEDRLRDAGRRKDEFLAMLAHELRNPLAPIRTGLELIRVAGDTRDAVERVRSTMERQVVHMVRLIDDLLDVSRITSGRIQLQREPTLLSGLLSSAIDANLTAMTARKIQLKIDVPETPWVLDVDPTRFVQVLSNLLHNATKFTPSGGSIVVTAHAPTVDGAIHGELSLSVRDSGIGIPEAFLPRVFDMFSQADRSTSDSGLGIGLALAQRLVEMHGGRIEVRSDGSGQGSEFIIRLPVSTQMPIVERPAVLTELRRITSRVVVIDDNRDAAVVTAMLIEELGGVCHVAYDAESGLRAIRDYRPDAIFLDVGMAGMDGYEACRCIRREFGDELIVVALTGFGQEGDKEKAVRAGFNAHLTKPADPAALMAVLATKSP